MISRRRFLASSAAAALLPSVARAAGAPIPIFDAHIHSGISATATSIAPASPGSISPSRAFRHSAVATYLALPVSTPPCIDDHICLPVIAEEQSESPIVGS